MTRSMRSKIQNVEQTKIIRIIVSDRPKVSPGPWLMHLQAFAGRTVAQMRFHSLSANVALKPSRHLESATLSMCSCRFCEPEEMSAQSPSSCGGRRGTKAAKNPITITDLVQTIRSCGFAISPDLVCEVLRDSPHCARISMHYVPAHPRWLPLASRLLSKARKA